MTDKQEDNDLTPSQSEDHNQKDEVEKNRDEEFEKDIKESTTRIGQPELDRVDEVVYRQALRALNASGIKYAVGSSFARYAYTGIWRYTKDLDVFLKHEDLKDAFFYLEQAGFETEIEFEHWLAKARKGEHFVDLIFGTGHGQIAVDDASFEGSKPEEILGVPTQLMPLEWVLASAMFVAERRRFDGAEVIHLIKYAWEDIDWQRILNRLGDNRELLLWHLILFDFVYPGHSDYLPQELMVALFDEARRRWTAQDKDEKSFRGTLIDPFAFTVDIEDLGYEDRRNTESLVDEEGEEL